MNEIENNHDEYHEKIKNLSYRSKVEAYCKFESSRKMKMCDYLSQWTIIISSISMLCLTSLDALNILSSSYGKLLSFLQIIGSGFILGYSVLLGMSGFSVRYIKFHEAGLKMNKLRKEIDLKIKTDVNEIFSEYESLVLSYDNHDKLIYEMVVNVELSESCSKTTKFLYLIYYYKYVFHYVLVMFISFLMIIFSCYEAWMSIYEK